jgi:hypothetical protein
LDGDAGLLDKHLRGTPTDRRFDRFPTEQELDAALAAARDTGKQ